MHNAADSSDPNFRNLDFVRQKDLGHGIQRYHLFDSIVGNF